MKVRALRSDEGPLLKALRLRALAESPDAFGQTLADALEQPDPYWENATRSVTEPNRHIMFLAEDAERPVGLAFGLLDPARADTGRVAGMWVDPELRGRGLGRALLDAVVGWARGRGLTRLELWVTEGNLAATALYQRAGFRTTGRRDPLPSHPNLETIQMTLDLENAGHGSGR
jgi:GNAT superfamily N-acetyltransferase